MKVKVKCSTNRSIQVVDKRQYDNPLFEAARRSILEWAKQPRSKVSCIIECKTWKDTCLFNTYYVLIGAGMLDKAELLRKKFQNQFGIDLRNENVTNGVEKPTISS